MIINDKIEVLIIYGWNGEREIFTIMNEELKNKIIQGGKMKLPILTTLVFSSLREKLFLDLSSIWWIPFPAILDPSPSARRPPRWWRIGNKGCQGKIILDGRCHRWHLRWSIHFPFSSSSSFIYIQKFFFLFPSRFVVFICIFNGFLGVTFGSDLLELVDFTYGFHCWEFYRVSTKVVDLSSLVFTVSHQMRGTIGINWWSRFIFGWYCFYYHRINKWSTWASMRLVPPLNVFAVC